MPFELTNASASFQAFINDFLRFFLESFCTIYLDDVLVYNNTLKQHKTHIQKMINALTKTRLYLKPEKCRFYKQQMKYLDFMISKDEIAMNSIKIKAIKK